MCLSIDFSGYGRMICQFCWGKGHRIGVATTTTAECSPCSGRGYIDYGLWPSTNHPLAEGHRRMADDKGPGAPRTSGAPAPDANDHPVLKQARAC